MKDFLKYTLATVVGILVFNIVFGIIAMIGLMGMVASSASKSTPSIADNSVLVLKMKGTINEQTPDDMLSFLTDGDMQQQGLNDILAAITKAKDNEKVKGIYIETGVLQTDYATLQEIRNALKDFKKSGKWIIAYGETVTQDSYYLASVADKIYINKIGELDWHGLASQPEFIKGFLAKLGIKVNFIKVGKFKSYGERYTEDKMSDANREQVTRFVAGTWKAIVKDVSASRGISEAKLNTLADSFMFFSDPNTLVKEKMVDGLCYNDEIRDIVKKKLGIDSDKEISQVNVADMAAQPADDKGDLVAVYYLEGDIVSMPTSSTFGSGQEIVQNTVCDDLAEMMNDDDVKAVVMRINSGGGSAYASEQIWHQIELLKKKKPVVVSMGGMAASGAYYISSAANWIVAQPTTLTGSIGIFAAVPEFSELMTKKLGLKYDFVKTNQHSDFGALDARPLSDSERAIIQGSVNRGYELFRKRVADGRKLPVAQVEKIAQGRVWLGTDALGIKLVDQLGGTADAVKKAAQLAKLKEYHAANYTEPVDFLTRLMDENPAHSYLDEQARAIFGEYYEPLMLIHCMQQQDYIMAAMPMKLNIK